MNSPPCLSDFHLTTHQVNKNVYLKGRLGADGIGLMAAFKSWFQPSVALAAVLEHSWASRQTRTGLTVQVRVLQTHGSAFLCSTFLAALSVWWRRWWCVAHSWASCQSCVGLTVQVQVRRAHVRVRACVSVRACVCVRVHLHHKRAPPGSDVMEHSHDSLTMDGLPFVQRFPAALSARADGNARL